MQTLKFYDNYLNEEALVTLVENKSGDILFEGIAANTPYMMLKHTVINKIAGLGMNDDIVIYVSKLKEYDTEVEEF